MPTLTVPAFDLAERLLSENRSGRSWRAIAREDYRNRVNFATLNRIANSGGAWLPKERKILRALGLVERRKRTPIQKAISRMVRDTRKAMIEMSPNPIKVTRAQANRLERNLKKAKVEVKEEELRKHTTCSNCGKKIGHTGLPGFWVLKVERHMIDLRAVKRQDGLAAMLDGDVVLAQVMGPDEDMTLPMMESVEITLCEECALGDVNIGGLVLV